MKACCGHCLSVLDSCVCPFLEGRVACVVGCGHPCVPCVAHFICEMRGVPTCRVTGKDVWIWSLESLS